MATSVAQVQQEGPLSQTQQQPTIQQQQQPVISNIACRSLCVKSNPTLLRMSPPATLRNWKFHKPLLAVGSKTGLVQIFNLSTGKLHRELKVHSYPIVGIEWIGLNAFISYANSESASSSTRHNQQQTTSTGDVIWELCITELNTGRTVKLKTGHSNDSSLIQAVKASHLRQYFIVIYKSNPFEIWDLDTLSLLKRVPKKFSSIVAAEWSPLYSKRVEAVGSKSITDQDKSSSGNSVPANAPLRENFVVTNKQGELFHFSIAGSVVKEVSRIPPESTMNKPVTAIAWKSDHVFLGQDNGNINVWDLEKKESRTMCTMRGCIRKIRFAPGRGNMKILLLFDDGVDIWDIKKLRLISSYTDNNDPRLTNVIDADWAASDRPVILSSDGTALITDVELKKFSSDGSGRKGSGSSHRDPYRGAGGAEVGQGSSSANSNEACYLQ